MEKELNYLSEKIEKVEFEIDKCKFAIELDFDIEDDLKELQSEKELLDSILSVITLSELESKSNLF